jgi:hypothetical protein
MKRCWWCHSECAVPPLRIWQGELEDLQLLAARLSPPNTPHNHNHETHIAFRPRACPHPGQVSMRPATKIHMRPHLRLRQRPLCTTPTNTSRTGSPRRATSSSPSRRITPSARGTAQMASVSAHTRATRVPSGPSMSTLTPACSRPAAPTTP